MATDELTANHDPAPASQAVASPSGLAIRTSSVPEVKTEDGSEFDIFATYHRLLDEDQDLAMPVAAIEALIELLGHTTSSTVMETLDIVKAQADRLKRAVLNPIPLTAGTDLFQQYLLRSLKQPYGARLSAAGAGPSSFDETRQHLLRNSRVFAARAKDARKVIALKGARYVTPGSTVLTAGGSRLVKMLLCRAAELRTQLNGSPDFKVIYVMDGSRDCEPAAKALRERGVPVATVDVASMAHVLMAGRVDMVIVGAEAVLQNGGILSRMGTFQLAQLANAFKKSFYVVSETHKFVRVFPLSQSDLARCGVKQNVLDFRTLQDAEHHPKEDEALSSHDKVDYTPPNLIKSIITELGVKIPTAVYEMLLDIYT